MVGQVDHSGRIRRGAVVDAQLIFRGQLVGQGDVEITGVVFFPVRAGVVQLDAFRAIRGDFPGHRPDLFVKAFQPAVQVVDAGVDRQVIGFAIQAELALRDAVGIAPDDAAKKWIMRP